MFSLLPSLPLQLQDGLKDRIATHIKTYEEPQLDELGNPVPKSKYVGGHLEEEQKTEEEDDMMMDEMKRQMPLQEGVLKVNMGIPIVVVCSKVDLLMKEDSSSERKLEKNLDFIQRHLRTTCLQYGASLMFVSTLSSINTELLYRYVLH